MGNQRNPRDVKGKHHEKGKFKEKQQEIKESQRKTKATQGKVEGKATKIKVVKGKTTEK